MTVLSLEGFKVFPTLVSQLDNPVVKQVFIALKDT
jgi:hypothetical protein